MKPTKQKQPKQPAQPTQPTRASGSERARDEQRTGGGPRYGGEDWKVADERGANRFGHARNDDTDPSELKPGEAATEDNDAITTSDPELAEAEQNREIESSGQRAGMRRGEKPRKSKDRQP